MRKLLKNNPNYNGGMFMTDDKTPEEKTDEIISKLGKVKFTTDKIRLLGELFDRIHSEREANKKFIEDTINEYFANEVEMGGKDNHSDSLIAFFQKRVRGDKK